MKKICPKCGAENDEQAKFCMNCAELLQKNDDNSKENIPDGMRDDSLHEQRDVKNSHSIKKYIGIAAAIVVVIAVMIALMTRPKTEKIIAKYNGELQAGVVLDDSNTGITVYAIDDKGNTEEVSGWKIAEPQTLEMDKTSEVEITYKKCAYNLAVECESSELTSITVEYDGDDTEGTDLDSYNDGIKVYATYKNGTSERVKDGWEVSEPVTLEADKTSDVTISYGGKEAELSVACSTSTLTGIYAKYSGSKRAGVWISEKNEDIKVYAKYKNGQKERVYDWTIVKKAKLKAGQTSTVTIEYKDKQCQLSVKCTTKTPQMYKDSCIALSYDDAARRPDDYEGRDVRFSGEVLQVLEDDGWVQMRVDVGDFDVVYIYYKYQDGESKFLEDDYITFYGTSEGLYSYESVMGETITIPLVYAKYIDR